MKTKTLEDTMSYTKEIIKSKPQAIGAAIDFTLEDAYDVEKQFLGPALEKKLQIKISQVIDKNRNGKTCLTVRRMSRLAENWKFTTKDNKSLAEFHKLTKESFNLETSADIAFVHRDSDKKAVTILEATSIKASISEKFGGYMAIWNDAPGDTYHAITNGHLNKTLGNVLMVPIDLEAGLAYNIMFDGTIEDLTSLFSEKTEHNAGWVFEKKNLVDKINVPALNRTQHLIKVFEREEISYRADGTPNKQSSYNRGILIKKPYLLYLAKNNLAGFQLVHTHEFDLEKIDDAAFRRDCPMWFD